MGLIIGILLAAAVWLALRRTRALNGASLQLAAAALLIGLAGYSLQGRAGLVGSPAAELPRRPLPPVLQVELAGEFYGRFNVATPWIVIANGYMARGDGANAVTTLISAVRASPRNSELWIALGNGLVSQNGGRMSPAAQLAFAKSIDLAPQHPGPRFFYGLAMLQQGKVDQGLVLWKQILRDAPPGASWRPNLAARVAVVEQIRRVTPAGG
ncbi:MAG TPA: hypothetical protein VEZ48_12920 [Sphingomonadaceae bacterium]|nr:hypothetical protein [Sphingomonadaceae bacterium]